ncbi:MAG: HAMP domain-containing protein, partial [Hyphomicrobiales bacterium]
MKFRLSLTPAILIPVAITIAMVAGLTLFLSASSNMASVERTLADRQNEMIMLVSKQFSGNLRFNKLETVTNAFAGYQEDADFGLIAGGGVDRNGATSLSFGDNPTLAARAVEIAAQALATESLASTTEGEYHIAAYPAYFGKDRMLSGALAMVWDLSIHRPGIIAQQVTNGLVALAIALVGLGVLVAILVLRVTRPLKAMTGVASRLAQGELDIEVKGAHRGDELGDLARAIEVFRANSETVRSMTEEEAARILSDQQARQQMMQELQQAFGEVVDAPGEI